MVLRGLPMRFLADAMVGRLAKWLRALGYDTLYHRDGDDEALLATAAAEGRVLLTRDTRLPRASLPAGSLLIRSDRVEDQIREVLQAYDLRPAAPGTRCLRCNTPLAPLPREAAAGRVPDFVLTRHATFRTCPACRRVYWPGTHRTRMAEVLARLCG
jgi:uncharacterized protein with PIN domain